MQTVRFSDTSDFVQGAIGKTQGRIKEWCLSTFVLSVGGTEQEKWTLSICFMSAFPS